MRPFKQSVLILIVILLSVGSSIADSSAPSTAETVGVAGAAVGFSALMGSMGTIETCYPGLLQQVIAQIKPFALPCASPIPIAQCLHKGQPWATLVAYWVPRYAIEVTGQAGTTIFTPLPTTGLPGGMVSGEGANGANTKYKEAHVYAFSISNILEIVGGNVPFAMCMATGGDTGQGGLPVGMVLFGSEAVPSWKLGVDPTGVPVNLPMAWGSLYPRQGWVNHPSNITSSLLTALRAQDLASDTFLVAKPTPLFDKYEIGGPNPGACYPIGTPTTTMEIGANRPGCADRVITIYWEFVVSCCAFGL